MTATAYARPETGLATSVTLDPGTGHLALATATAYEEPSLTTFFRPLSRTLPAGNATTYAYYGATEVPTNPGCVGGNASQAGRVHTATEPDPDGAGPQVARVNEFLYDAAGRTVGSRIGTGPWTCVTYDPRGRVLTRSIPAFGGQPARTVTYAWAVGGTPANPLTTSVADASGTITTTVDLLGRVSRAKKNATATAEPA